MGAMSVVLHVPHASTVIPEDVRAGILLDGLRGSPGGAGERRIHRVLLAATAASQRSGRPAEMVVLER